MLTRTEERENNCKIEVDNNLRANDDSATLQEEGKVAGEIETAGEPPAPGNVQLRAALVGEGADVEDGVLEGDRVERPAVPDGAELGDGDAVRARARRRLVVPPQLGARRGRGRGERRGQHQCQDDLRSRAALQESAIFLSTAHLNRKMKPLESACARLPPSRNQAEPEPKTHSAGAWESHHRPSPDHKISSGGDQGPPAIHSLTKIPKSGTAGPPGAGITEPCAPRDAHTIRLGATASMN